MTTTPNWVTNQLFERAFKRYLNNLNVEVVGFESVAAIPIGENYTSDLYRTSVEYKCDEKEGKKSLPVIVKCFPQNGIMVEVIEFMGAFETEGIMYTLILPAIENLLGPTSALSPKCLSFTKQPKSVLILEDLSVQSFKTHARREGLDLEHVLLATEKLAIFHAASAALIRENPLLVEHFIDGMHRDVQITHHWLSVAFNAVMETCKTCPSLEKFYSKLEKIKDQATLRTLEASKVQENDFNVLNHGDPWVNNFMYRYDNNGKLKDFRFIDFQFVLYGSPVIDLHYLWATSPSTDVLAKHLNTFLNHYYDVLCKTLNKLQYPKDKIPTFQQLYNDYITRAFYGMTAAFTVMALCKSENRSDASFDELLKPDESAYRNAIYNTEHFRKTLEVLLPYYDKMGVFDCPNNNVKI